MSKQQIDLLFYSSCSFPQCLFVLFWAVSPSSSSHPFLIFYFLNRKDCRAPRVRNSACLCINVWPESTHNTGVWFFSLIFTLGQFFFFFFPTYTLVRWKSQKWHQTLPMGCHLVFLFSAAFSVLFDKPGLLTSSWSRIESTSRNIEQLFGLKPQLLNNYWKIKQVCCFSILPSAVKSS